MEMSLGTLRTTDEWIQFLVDPGTFVPLLTHSSHSPGFGHEVVTGFAKVRGQTIALWACRPDVDQGSITSNGSIKIRRLMDRALELGIPIVSLLASAGVSLHEGVKSGEEYSRVLMGTTELSGQIPQIACVMGVNIGAPAYSAALQDLVLFNRTRSYLCVSGPGVVKQVLGESATFQQLGGAALHFQETGLANFVDATPELQLRRCQWLINFLPPNWKSEAPILPSAPPLQPLPVVPENPQAPFDMFEFIAGLVDRSELIEYGAGYGAAAICGFVRIGGFPVALIANQSLVMSGSLDVTASRKIARFIRVADASNIPTLTLIDAPGFMPGSFEEKRGILQAGADLIFAMQTRSPKMSVVVRKCYGAAAIVLCATRNWKGDLVLALPTSRNAVMGFEAAQATRYKNDSRSEAEQRQDYFQSQEDLQNSLALGLVDEIVAPEGLRGRLIQHLEILAGKRPNPQSRVRPIGPL